MILQLTIDLLINPLFLLGIIYLVCFMVFDIRRIAKKETFLIHLLMLIFSFDIWVFEIPYSNIEYVGYIIFCFVLTLLIFLDLKRTRIKLFTGFLFLSLATSAIISIILYPILNEANNQQLITTLLLFNTTIPTLLYYMSLASMLSFLWGFCSTYVFDMTFRKFLRRNIPLMSLRKAVFTYYQIIPISLLPIILAQLFSRTDLLERFASIISFFSSTFLIFLIIAIVLGFLGERILKTKFMWVTSIFTFVSVSSILFLAFQYIVWKVNNGSWIVGFILIPLIGFVSGTITQRSCNAENHG